MINYAKDIKRFMVEIKKVHMFPSLLWVRKLMSL